MDAKSTDPYEKDRLDNKPRVQDSLGVVSGSSQTESSTQDTSLSEQTSTDDTQISTTEIFREMPVFRNKTTGGVAGSVSITGPCSVEKDQPRPLYTLLPPSMEVCTVYEESQSFNPINKSEDSLKTMTVNMEPDNDDLCAAILLACLFCHPLDCLLSTMRGCNESIWALCSYLCGCKPPTLQPLLDVAGHCGCLGVHCCQCECHVCDICLQATECLDLAMEISQMLYH